MSILGFEFYLGPKVVPPEQLDFTKDVRIVRSIRKAWAKKLREAIQYHDAWGILITKPNGDVILFDTWPGSEYTATGWGGTTHLLLGKESQE